MYIVLLGPGRDQGPGQCLHVLVLVHLRGPLGHLLGPDRDREAGDNLNRQKKKQNTVGGVLRDSSETRRASEVYLASLVHVKG